MKLKQEKGKNIPGFSVFKYFTGLTFREWWQLRILKKKLKNGGMDSRIPDSTQKTITFEKMFRDGICKVRSGYYTKMIGFDDLNYVLQDEEAQVEILGLYSQFINYFEPGIHFQIFLFNRQVGEETLIKRFEIDMQGNKHDIIRKEYSGIEKNLCAKGNNGVVKGKYVIFGIEAKSYKEARAKLNMVERDVIQNLGSVGTIAKAVNGKERLRLFHEFFHQDSMEPFRFSFEEMAESGKSVKDYIAPAGFDFRFPSRLKCGQMFGSVHYLDIIAPKMNDELLKRLLDIDSNITVSIHMQTMDPVEAIKKLKSTLSDIQKMKIEEQKKAVRSGYDMDILPTDIVTYEKDTMELLNDLNSSNQKLVLTTFLIGCFGKTKKEMESLTQRVAGIIGQANCNLQCLQYQQEQGINALAPIGANDLGIERVLTTKSSAIFIPFNTQELFMEGQALYYGLIDKRMAYFIPFGDKNKEIYNKGISIEELFNISVTGILSGRDRVSIALTKKELEQRIEIVRNAIDEKDIDTLWEKYSRGQNAKKIQADILSGGQITPVSFRPFDDRWTYYSGNSCGWVLWPREKRTMGHLIKEPSSPIGANIGLVFCKTSRYFLKPFVSKNIIAHRLFSDTCEITYIAPLFIYSDNQLEENRWFTNIKDEKFTELTQYMSFSP